MAVIFQDGFSEWELAHSWNMSVSEVKPGDEHYPSCHVCGSTMMPQQSQIPTLEGGVEKSYKFWRCMSCLTTSLISGPLDEALKPEVPCEYCSAKEGEIHKGYCPFIHTLEYVCPDCLKPMGLYYPDPGSLTTAYFWGCKNCHRMVAADKPCCIMLAENTTMFPLDSWVEAQPYLPRCPAKGESPHGMELWETKKDNKPVVFVCQTHGMMKPVSPKNKWYINAGKPMFTMDVQTITYQRHKLQKTPIQMLPQRVKQLGGVRGLKHVYFPKWEAAWGKPSGKQPKWMGIDLAADPAHVGPPVFKIPKIPESGWKPSANWQPYAQYSVKDLVETGAEKVEKIAMAGTGSKSKPVSTYYCLKCGTAMYYSVAQHVFQCGCGLGMTAQVMDDMVNMVQDMEYYGQAVKDFWQGKAELSTTGMYCPMCGAFVKWGAKHKHGLPDVVMKGNNVEAQVLDRLKCCEAHLSSIAESVDKQTNVLQQLLDLWKMPAQ